VTDLEITKLCAEAMGYKCEPHPNRKPYPHLMWVSNGQNWNPLKDKAQAFELVEKLKLQIDWASDGKKASAQYYWDYPLIESDDSPDLLRAVCECAAKVQKAKGEL